MRFRAFILLAALTLCSCSYAVYPPSGLLDYQSPPFTYNIAYEKEGFSAECELVRADSDNLTLTYRLPETLNGVSMRISGIQSGNERAVTLCASDIALPLTEALSDAEIIAAALSLDIDCLLSYSADAESGVCSAVFETCLGEAAAVFESESGEPISVELHGVKIHF